jgi:hypothetical protein
MGFGGLPPELMYRNVKLLIDGRNHSKPHAVAVINLDRTTISENPSDGLW